MDDLTTIRTAYGEPAPPTLQEITQARALLEQAPATAPRRRWLPVGLGVLATGAAAAVAVATLGAGGGGVTPSPSAPQAAPSARQMVLAAAHQAEQRTTKRFLTVHSRHCFALPVRAKTGTYLMQPCDESWQWAARDRAGDSAIWSRNLATKPSSPRDAELWKKAGSPRGLPYRDLPERYPDMYKVDPTPWKEDPSDRNSNSGKFFLSGLGREVTAAQFQDPAVIREAVREKLNQRKRLPPGVKVAPGRGEPEGPGQALVRVRSTVQDLPLSPKGWAEVIRALSDVPGVVAVGRVTDPLGRSGVALEGTRTNGRGSARTLERVIFDPRTGELLASTSTLVQPATGKNASFGEGYRPGTVVSSDVSIRREWTDRRPTAPEGVRR
ncbi:hypothetical protein [Actinomadura hibisca]|uniref:hypothetical protein n=1 Tax=Actinomadura hibisca TaxID=68565 RepID=UPI0008362F8B|nr:hypothetical protein [Actinomadura hibisca]